MNVHLYATELECKFSHLACQTETEFQIGMGIARASIRKSVLNFYYGGYCTTIVPRKIKLWSPIVM